MPIITKAVLATRLKSGEGATEYDRNLIKAIYAGRIHNFRMDEDRYKREQAAALALLDRATGRGQNGGFRAIDDSYYRNFRQAACSIISLPTGGERSGGVRASGSTHV